MFGYLTDQNIMGTFRYNILALIFSINRFLFLSLKTNCKL